MTAPFLTALRVLLLILGLSQISTVDSSAASGNDTARATFQPNLLVVLLGSVPASMLYTADKHVMSASSSAFYAANLRLLERNSLVFQNAYINIARSAPSRTSILTSLHPRRQLGIMGDESPSASQAFQQSRQTVIPAWLRSSLTIENVGAGRIFKSPQATVSLGGFQQYAIPKLGDQDTLCGDEPFVCVLQDETALTDNDVADRAVTYLRQFARSQQNFAMLVGFHRAYADKSFPTWTQTQMENRRRLILAQQQDSSYATQTNTMFTVNAPKRLTVNEVNDRKVSAFGAVQWVDFCLGKIIDELRGLRFWDNTIIIVTSDTAQSVGEFSDVSPDGSAVYEHSTRVPLLIRDPRSPKSFGKRSGARVELVDLATTVYDLMGAGRPPNGPPSSKLKLQGTSLRGLLNLYQNDPRATVPGDAYFNTSLRHAAFTESARCTRSVNPFYSFPAGTPLPAEVYWTDCAEYPGRVDALAISMRTARYRYTEYRTALNGQVIWETEGLVGRELFSHDGDNGLETSVDANRFELVNLAPCPDTSCRLLVPPATKATTTNPSVGLAADPKNKDFYTAPALPADPALARLVRAYSLMLRSAGRDGSQLCSGHGLVNPDTGACEQCDEGWASATCAIPTFPELDPSGEDVTVSPTISPPPTTRPPVGAPTLPPAQTNSPTPTASRITPAPTPKVTSSPTPKVTSSPTAAAPLTCAGRKTQALCAADSTCIWQNNACQQITASPTLGGAMKDSCQSILASATCQKINGCAWQGKEAGCQVPLPTACGCETRLSLVSAFVIEDRASGTGDWQLFRNPCHATCKGAILPTESPTPRPTPPTARPTTPAPTYPQGLPLPTLPGQGNAQPVDTLTLYLVLDASTNMADGNEDCLKQRGFSCIHIAAVYFDRVVQLLQDFVKQGVSKFRVGIWAFSCQDSEPIWIDIKLPTRVDSGVSEALRSIRNNITPRGGRCPSKVLQVIREHDSNERLMSSRRALILMNAGVIGPNDLIIAADHSRELREAGVATFSVVVSRADFGHNVPRSREDGLKLAGKAERVFFTNPKQGVLALTSMVSPMAAAILATVNEPARVEPSSSDDPTMPDDFLTSEGYSEGESPSPVGPVLGVLTVMFLVAAAAFVVYRRRKRSHAMKEHASENMVLDVVVGAPSRLAMASSAVVANSANGIKDNEFEVARASPMKTAVRRRSLDLSSRDGASSATAASSSSGLKVVSFNLHNGAGMV